MHESYDKSSLGADGGDYKTMLDKIAWIDVTLRHHTLKFVLEIMHMYEYYAFHNRF